MLVFLFDAFQIIAEASIWPSGNRLKSRHLNVCFGVTLDSSSTEVGVGGRGEGGETRAAVPSGSPCPLP